MWGSCLGFQTISALASENSTIVTCGFDSESLPLPLHFTPAARASRLYSAMPADVVGSLGSQAYTLNFHSCGVTPAAAAASETFQRGFQVRRGRN